MAQLSDIRNLLQRDGTSQAQRQLAALEPAYVKVDEREVEDFLVFAQEFARQVIYYDLDNKDVGDWRPFFACDISVLIAAIQKTNPLPIKKNVEAALKGPSTPANLQELFTELIKLARLIDDWKEGLDNSKLLQDKISKLITANLATVLGRLVAYERGMLETSQAYKGFATEGVAYERGMFETSQAYKDFVTERIDKYIKSRYKDFSKEWKLDVPKAVLADTTLFGTTTDEAEQIEAVKGKLGELFVALYNVLLEIIGIAPEYFDATLTDKQSNHEPHLALFIAFLKLYLQVRDDANELTKRHLDFYYEDVLGLETKPAVPDSVHLFFLLARQKDEYEIDAETALDAGPDATGIDLVYTLDKDLVANVAQVDSFRTVFVTYDLEDNDPPEVKKIQSVYAAPQANSQDGLGAEIEDEDKPSWSTLGSAEMPVATLGFLVASRALLLAEGTRIITLDLGCTSLSADLHTADLTTAFTLALSGEEAWIEPTSVTVAVVAKSSDPEGDTTTFKGTIRFEITLGLTDAAVTAFDAEALGEDYGTTLPLIKVVLAEDNAAYDILKGLTLQGVTLAVDVDEVRTLIVQNDQFTMDATKPFQPFGPLPIGGSNFYVGSAEVFEKKLTALDLIIEWDALPETFAAHYEGYYDPNDPPLTGDFRADISVLQDKEWLTPITGEALFEDQDGRIVAARTLSVAAGLSGFEPRTIGTLEEWNPSTQNGFARLTLTPQDFSHGDFVNVLTRQTLAVGKLPDEMFGAQYKLSTYQFRVVDSGEKLLFLSTKNDFANEDAAQTAYDELLVQAGIRDRYDLTTTAPFGFVLKDAAGAEIATHPTTYANVGDREDAIIAIIAKVTADKVIQPLIVNTIEVGNSNDVNGAPDGEVILPNEPYTPTIKSFHLNYTASINSEDDTDALTFIHLYPFGYLPAEIPTDDAVAEAKQAKDSSVVKPFLVPQFDDEGTLYLGIKGLEPLQSLSILFQVAESTADTDLEKAKVVWSYLADNAWVLFEDFEITADTTKELIASGIVTFSIPRGITSGNTRLLAINADEEALHWIKAAVEATVERNDAGEVTALALHAGAVSELIDAHTQAVKATFDDDGNDPDHLKTPLEAETIGGLVEDDANIDTVSQLYDSFGGRPAETGLTFYTRISERLRHKGRAITLFDYERLVLEQFPGIYKVKCINHTNDDHALAPGHVLIAVIPDFTQLKAVDARAPKVTFDTLDDIQTFLNKANCPFVAVVDPDHYLHVRNPIYEKVTVDFKVKFKPEITAIGFHKRKLNDAIIRFLSPWAFDEGDEINFGGIVYKSSILNFVEKQNYVDYVTDFLMRHKDAETDVDAIEAETPRSILIPAEEHPIAEIVEDDCVPEHAQTHAGIGHMTLHKDFEVSQP